MTLFINFISSLIGSFFLFLTMVLSFFVFDLSNANTIIWMIAISGLSLLLISRFTRWFAERTEINPHRGLVTLFYVVAFFYALGSLPRESDVGVDENSLGLVSFLLLGMFAWLFVKALLHNSNSQIKDKVVHDAAELNLRDDEPTEADIEVEVVTDKKPANEQEIDGFALPEEFIVFDLETTGLSPHDCEIIEIGAIKVNRDSGEHITFQALVKPSIPIPSKITHITGITQKMINKDGEDIKAVIPEFLDFIGDLRLVAYNARFDMGFINAAVAKQGLKIKNPHSCALKMARRAWPDLESYKLVDVAERGGLSAKGNHRALKDAELTMTVYASAAETLGSLS